MARGGQSATPPLFIVLALLITSLITASGCSGLSSAQKPPSSKPVPSSPAGTATLTASPSKLSFGNVTVGSNSTLAVTLNNSGTSNIAVSNVSLSGPGFDASGVSTGQIIPPGQTATLNVTLAPSATGNAAGSITVTSNAVDSTLTIALAGAGAQRGTSHSASLSWSTSPSPSVTGYKVYRASASGGETGTAAINGSVLDAGNSFTDTNVTAGATYYYVVTTVNSSNTESVFSNEISGTIPTP
jgi:hypothetical protein